MLLNLTTAATWYMAPEKVFLEMARRKVEFASEAYLHCASCPGFPKTGVCLNRCWQLEVVSLLPIHLSWAMTWQMNRITLYLELHHNSDRNLLFFAFFAIYVSADDFWPFWVKIWLFLSYILAIFEYFSKGLLASDWYL